jgi:hypothetical protein
VDYIGRGSPTELCSRSLVSLDEKGRPTWQDRKSKPSPPRAGWKTRANCVSILQRLFEQASLDPVDKEHDLRLFKDIPRAAGLILMLVACVNISAAQEPAKAEDSASAQKSVAPFSFPDFTAIQKIGPGGGQRPLMMKVYFSGSTVRVELSPKIINLFVTSTAKVYRIETFPDKVTSCVSMRRDQVGFMASPLEMLQGAKVERTPAGTDVVDGHKTKVEDVVVTRADGKTMKSKVWESDEFQGVPIKIISDVPPAPKAGPEAKPMKIGALYGDITFEKVDPALLTPPDNCKPVEQTYKVVEQKVVK